MDTPLPATDAQANVPAQEAKTKAEPRVSPPDEHQGRAERPLETPAQRAQAVDARVKRRFRLSDDRDFRRVRREGQTWTGPLLVLRVADNGRDHSRFGFSVSKKVGKAAARNRAKRLMRESIRHRVSDISRGADVVLTARPGIQDSDLGEVDKAVAQLLVQAGLLEGSS